MVEDFMKMLDAVYQLAEFNGMYYRALLEQGFDEDQALELVGVVTATMVTSDKEGYNAK
jgi:hypothetical protein